MMNEMRELSAEELSQLEGGLSPWAWAAIGFGVGFTGFGGAAVALGSAAPWLWAGIGGVYGAAQSTIWSLPAASAPQSYNDYGSYYNSYDSYDSYGSYSYDY